MAISRYRNTNILENSYYATFDFPDKKDLDNITTIKVRVGKFERLDNLAFKYLGSGEYWWVIAILNDLDWAYDLDDAQILKIPLDIQDVLRLI